MVIGALVASRSRATAVLGVGLALCLVAAGCSVTHHDNTDRTTEKVRADGPTVVTTPSGITLSLPAGASRSKAVTLSTSAAPQVKLPAGVEMLSREVDVTIDGELGRPATITFPAPSQLSGTVLPMVLWQDGHGGWQAVATSWKPGDKAVTATVNHFSGGVLAAVNVVGFGRGLINQIGDFFAGLGRAKVEQPTCSATTEAKALVTVTSSGGDSVKWCVGRENGSNVLKVANNRSTFLEETYPSSWTVLDGGSISASTNTVARAMGAAYRPGAGRSSRIVDGGDTITLKIPDGASGTLVADMSVMAWLTSGVFDAIEAVALRFEALGAAGKATFAKQAVWARLVLGAGAGEEVRAMRSCGKDIGDVSDEPADFDHTESALTLAYKCGVQVAAVVAKNGAVKTGAAALAALNDVLDLAKDLTKFTTSGLRQIWDDAASIGGKSDPEYKVSVQNTHHLYVYAHDDVGIDVLTAQDAAQLTGTPEDLRAFLVSYAQRVHRRVASIPDCATGAPLSVSAYDTTGFAALSGGDECGIASEEVVGRVNGAWKVIWGGQEEPQCSEWQQLGLPTDFVQRGITGFSFGGAPTPCYNSANQQVPYAYR